MKITNLILNLLVLGSASATIKIAIDNQKIKDTVQELEQDGFQIAQSQQAQQVAQALKNARREAILHVRQSQKAILTPAISDLKNYVKYFTPSQDCDVNQMATCLDNYQQTGQPLVMGMQGCSTASNCTTSWEDLSIDQKIKLETKFGKSSQQMSQAFGELGQEITQSYQAALVNNTANSKWLLAQYSNETSNILKKWGCNATCVDSFANQFDNYGPAIEQCQCPSAIKYNVTNEPFDQSTVDMMKNLNTELTDNSTAYNSSVGVQDGQLSANVNVNGLTTTVVLIFALQLVFCFGICCYTNSQVQQAQNREEKQKADFYSFLYQFHKQMADEEQAMQELYGKQGGGGTPGANKL